MTIAEFKSELYNLNKISCRIRQLQNSLVMAMIWLYPSSQSLKLRYKSKSKDQGCTIPGAWSPWRLNFVWRCIIFMDPQHTACFISPFWRQNFVVAPTNLPCLYLYQSKGKCMVNLRNMRFCSGVVTD